MSGKPSKATRLSRLWQVVLLMGMAAAAGTLTEGAGAEVPLPGSTLGTPADRSAADLLQFIDGSSLHGRLRSMSVDRGVGWQHPDAPSLISFRPTNIAWIRFEKSVPAPSDDRPSCRFRFNNGDEVFGDLMGLDLEHAQLRTAFGGVLSAPRESLQTITFLSKGYSVLYEGPTSADGWVQGKSGHGWDYRDGAFVATGMGTLGRDLKLTGSSSIAFDLAWNGQFSLIVAIYTSVLDRFDYSSSSYMFYFSPGYVSLQRVAGGAGAMNLGQAAISEMGRRNRLHLEIRANKEDGTLGLLVEDRLIQRWKDGAGFLAQGSGIVFFAQLEGPSVRLSNLKVAQWEGDFGMESLTNAPPKDDLVCLINRDRVTGKLERLTNSTLSVTSGQTALAIPLQRVNQIYLRPQSAKPPAGRPWEMRAFFAGGGTVAFDLTEWSQEVVRGNSSNFGEVTFPPSSVRQIQFNLNRSKPSDAEVEVLDQEVWDLP